MEGKADTSKAPHLARFYLNEMVREENGLMYEAKGQATTTITATVWRWNCTGAVR